MPNTNSEPLPNEENSDRGNTKEERRAAKEAERTAKAADREAKKQQRQAEKAENHAADSEERTSRREANRAAQGAEKASQRGAQNALSAAERAAKKEARNAARETDRAAQKEAKKTARDAQRAARNEARNMLQSGTNIRLDDAQCVAAINQCSLFDIMESEVKPKWVRTTLKKTTKVIYRQRKNELKRLRKYIMQLIDYALQNPTVDPLTGGMCDGVQNDPGNSGSGDGSVTSTASPFTTADPWTRTTPSDPWTQTPSAPADPWTDSTTLAPTCTVSQWSQWSQPYGFGAQERVRVITRPGVDCPEAQLLREERNITSTTSKLGESA